MSETVVKLRELSNRPRIFTVPSESRDGSKVSLRVDARSVVDIKDFQVTEEIIQNVKSKKLLCVSGNLPSQPMSICLEQEPDVSGETSQQIAKEAENPPVEDSTETVDPTAEVVATTEENEPVTTKKGGKK